MREVIDALRPAPGDVVIDATLGDGGHALGLLRRIAPGGRLIGLDVDSTALELAGLRLAAVSPDFSLHRSNFAGLPNVLRDEQLNGCDVIFADLGASSMQLDDPARGFSFKHDGPLDMRMDARTTRTAADVLATLPAGDLSAALLELADEPDHQRIAERIVQQQRVRPMTRTAELVRLVLAAKGLTQRMLKDIRARGEPHPAARVFQALRILVNDELAVLDQLLRIAPFCLRPGGRIGVISFHSGEDRRVKHAFREGVRSGDYAAISDEVIRPTPDEIRANPRSASAKFRWARRGPSTA